MRFNARILQELLKWPTVYQGPASNRMGVGMTIWAKLQGLGRWRKARVESMREGGNADLVFDGSKTGGKVEREENVDLAVS